jgi:PcfJ-like protein
MKWSQLKKRIEDCLADSVKKRVTFGSVSYRKAHDQEGRGWIAIDGKQILDMATYSFYMEFNGNWDNYEADSQELYAKNIFDQTKWHASLFKYLNLPIDEILHSDNNIIRAIGMLDYRVGKRRLKKIDISKENELVVRMYCLRCDVENIFDSSSSVPQCVDLTEKITPHSSRYKKITIEDSEKAQVKLNNASKTRKVRSLIFHIFNHDIPQKELDTAIAKEVYNGFSESVERKTLFRTLLLLESKSKLFKSTEHVCGVIALAKNIGDWRKPLEKWKEKSHNADQQFSELARYLLADYDVPRFMDKAWFQGDTKQQQWFKHLGAGNNIRTAEALPVPLTKKMAHAFVQAPQKYTIDAAFRWAQVQAMGGDKYLTDALLETKIVGDFRDNDFWLSVLRFFIRNPMLDPVHISPIIDYIWYQKYEHRERFLEQGVAEDIGPEQPNFSMRGRTVESLLRAVDAWHQQLGKEVKGGKLQWKKSEIDDYKFIEGSKESKNMKIWRIRELLNSNELVAEGREMKHCVVTYAHSCSKRICSIWTMDVETKDCLEKLLTIEVNDSKFIQQVRGKCNRNPIEKEKAVIKRWAQQEKLELASYI